MLGPLSALVFLLQHSLGETVKPHIEILREISLNFLRDTRLSVSSACLRMIESLLKLSQVMSDDTLFALMNGVTFSLADINPLPLRLLALDVLKHLNESQAPVSL
jgi:hypothetical protein